LADAIVRNDEVVGSIPTSAPPILSLADFFRRIAASGTFPGRIFWAKYVAARISPPYLTGKGLRFTGLPAGLFISCERSPK
jgi:hypothetical protein